MKQEEIILNIESMTKTIFDLYTKLASLEALGKVDSLEYRQVKNNIISNFQN